jgi:gliding motility-associated-like protein
MDLRFPLIYFEFSIFDSWGERVFRAYDITNGWDGTYKEVDAPMDVYSYIVNYMPDQSERKIITYGVISLLR